MEQVEQYSLLCGCGGQVDCPSCARRERLNREHFNGQREAVLQRDDYQCRVCAALAKAKAKALAAMKRQGLASHPHWNPRWHDSLARARAIQHVASLLVHHRRRKAKDKKWMITLCRHCHPIVHTLCRPSFAMVIEHPFLYQLWREQHPKQAEQMLLPLWVPLALEQVPLFEVGSTADSSQDCNTAGTLVEATAA